MRSVDIKQIKHLTISELFLHLHIKNLNEIKHPDKLPQVKNIKLKVLQLKPIDSSKYTAKCQG